MIAETDLESLHFLLALATLRVRFIVVCTWAFITIRRRFLDALRREGVCSSLSSFIVAFYFLLSAQCSWAPARHQLSCDTLQKLNLSLNPDWQKQFFNCFSISLASILTRWPISTFLEASKCPALSKIQLQPSYLIFPIRFQWNRISKSQRLRQVITASASFT